MCLPLASMTTCNHCGPNCIVSQWFLFFFWLFFPGKREKRKKKIKKGTKARTTQDCFIPFFIFFHFFTMSHEKRPRRKRGVKSKAMKEATGTISSENFIYLYFFLIFFAFCLRLMLGSTAGGGAKRKTECNWQNNSGEKSDMAQAKTESTLIHNSMGGAGLGGWVGATKSDFNMIRLLLFCEPSGKSWSAGLSWYPSPLSFLF